MRRVVMHLPPSGPPGITPKELIALAKPFLDQGLYPGS